MGSFIGKSIPQKTLKADKDVSRRYTVSMGHFLKTLDKNFIRVFYGKNILWHLLAILLTYASVVSGFDWLYFSSVRNPSLNAVLFPAVTVGFFAPIIIPIVLVLAGSFRKRKTMYVIGWALVQAGFLGWAISTVFKTFTGRVQPNVHNLLTDGSSGFHFGFLQHGIFWGWPSSHTTVAFAMAVTLFFLIPAQAKFIRALPLIYALYIAFGVSLSIHWFSDALAGAIIGSVIGNVVGKEFKKKLD